MSIGSDTIADDIFQALNRLRPYALGLSWNEWISNARDLWDYWYYRLGHGVTFPGEMDWRELWAERRTVSDAVHIVMKSFSVGGKDEDTVESFTVEGGASGGGYNDYESKEVSRRRLEDTDNAKRELGRGLTTLNGLEAWRAGRGPSGKCHL